MRTSLTSPGLVVQAMSGVHLEGEAVTQADEGGRALRILLIEDDRSTAVALRRLLTIHGHVVYLADSHASGFLDHLAKPIDEQLLLQALRHAMSHAAC
jgi:CheY-like chemotaxis protein